jgi:hypothetical protein
MSAAMHGKNLSTPSAHFTRRKGTDLACAVARLPVRMGLIMVERSIAYETTKVNVVIAGTVNLSDESLALVIRSAFKQGLGFDAGNLVGNVTGTMTNPSMGLDALGVGRQLLSLYAAFATTPPRCSWNKC